MNLSKTGKKLLSPMKIERFEFLFFIVIENCSQFLIFKIFKMSWFWCEKMQFITCLPPGNVLFTFYLTGVTFSKPSYMLISILENDVCSFFFRSMLSVMQIFYSTLQSKSRYIHINLLKGEYAS